MLGVESEQSCFDQLPPACKGPWPLRDALFAFDSQLLKRGLGGCSESDVQPESGGQHSKHGRHCSILGKWLLTVGAMWDRDGSAQVLSLLPWMAAVVRGKGRLHAALWTCRAYCTAPYSVGPSVHGKKWGWDYHQSCAAKGAPFFAIRSRWHKQH